MLLVQDSGSGIGIKSGCGSGDGDLILKDWNRALALSLGPTRMLHALVCRAEGRNNR